MLQVRKVIEYVYEKVLGQGSDSGSTAAGADRHEIDTDDMTAIALERVEIYCNDLVGVL